MSDDHSTTLWDVPPEKFCPKCKKWLAVDVFAKFKGKIRCYCRECHLAANDKPDLRTEKACACCKKIKPIADFSKLRCRFQPHCKQCAAVRMAKVRADRVVSGTVVAFDKDSYWKYRKWNKLKTKYGLTKNQYLGMVEVQGGLCAICKRPEREVFRGEVLDLSVDHDHETGKVRGLLCRQCNIGIGRLQESIVVLQSAIEYLRLHK